MKDYKLNLTFFLSTIGIFSMLITGSILLISNRLDIGNFLQLLLNYSFVTIPLSLIWIYFEKIGWRSRYWKWVRKFLNLPPDLRGRWEGTLDRVDENNPHKFVVEIKQTMTKIQVYTYSRRGGSESIIDSICSDKMEDDFILSYFWEGETGNLPAQSIESGKFKGYTLLKLINNKEGDRKLVGEYFTNRKPQQTMGKIEVWWKSFELLKQY